MTTSDSPIPEDQRSDAVRKHTGDSAPAPLKIMAARGLAPMAPRDLVTTQFVLTFDADDRIAKMAAKGLADMDMRIATAVFSDTDVHPSVLAHLATTFATQDAFVENILLNASTPNEAFLEVAKDCSEKICEIIASNQARILKMPEIARSLASNKNALQSTVDRVIDFLVRSGKILDDMHAFEEAMLRLNPDERIAAANAVENLPRHLIDERFLTEDERARRLITEDEDVYDEDANDQPLEVQLRTMNAAQKVALATKGTKAVRATLMRDTNRMVALAAITSPSVTEPEVLAAANSRTVHQDVVAHICRDKKNNWTRIYQVKVAIVSNPKSPLPEAMKLVPTLNPRDLKSVSKSRNVPMGVRNLANNLIRKKR